MIGHVCALTIVGGLVLATCCPKRGNASSDRCPIGPSTAFWPTRSPTSPQSCSQHEAAAYKQGGESGL